MAYIGNRPVSGDNNSFRVLDDIKTYTFSFDGSSSSVVSTSNNTITHKGHRLVQGQRVTYTDGTGSPIGGLTDATVYFVIMNDANSFKLASSASNAAAGTAINLTSVGSGTAHNINVAFDGVNTKFKATFNNGTEADVTRVAQIQISLNNVIQQPQNTATPTSGFGFESDSVIVFASAPASTVTFWGVLFANNFPTFEISDNDVDNFTGNGSTTEFSLSKSPASNENIIVTIDGVVQYPSDNSTTRAYNTVGNALQFSVAPHSDSDIQVRHIGFAGPDESGGVTAFYGRTGSVFLNNSDNIVVNDAEVTGNLTVQGDTTTLNTTLRNVELLRVDGNDTVAAGIITQRGSGDILKLYDSSTPVFVVKDGGKVGIGTDNPNAELDIEGAAARIHLHDHDGNQAQIIQSGNSLYLNLDAEGNGNGSLRIRSGGTTGDSEIIRIKSDGTVGIGSTAPTEKLDVIGNIKTSGTITGSSFVGDGDFVELDVDGQTDLDDLAVSGISTFSGSIKIQTSDLSKSLLIGDTAGSPVNYLGIQQASGSLIRGFETQYDNGSVFENLQGSMHQHLVLGDSTSGNNGTIFGISLTESGTNYERLKLTGVGDLFVASNLNLANDIIHTGDNTKIRFPSEDLITFETAGDERLRINSDGNVIIGATSWNFEKPLNVQGSSGSIISLYNGDTTTYAANTMSGIELKLRTGNTGTQRATCEIRAFKENGTNGDSARALSFYTGISGGSPTERLRITSDGEVRIADGGKITINTNVNGNYALQEAFRVDDGNSTDDRAFQIFEYHNSGARWFSLNQNLNVTTTGTSYTYTQGNYGGSNMIQMTNGDLRIYGDPSIVGGGTSAITPTEVVSILSNGKVLIGTDTEGHANADDLTIASSGDTGITIRSGTTNDGRIYFSDATSGAGEYAGSLHYDHNDNKFIIFTNGESRFIIDSNGKVLIGTDTEGHPNADDLTIATSGDTGITIRSGTTNNGRIYFSDATSGTGEVVGSLDYDHNLNSFNIFTNNQPRFTINSSGNLYAAGITTSANGFQFGSSSHYLYQSASDTATLRVTSDGPYAQFKDVSGDVQMGSASGTLLLSAGGAEKVRILTDGKVGIGTTNPLGLMHLYGSSPKLYFTDSDTNVQSHIDHDSSAGNFAINIDPNNNAPGDNSNFIVRFHGTGHGGGGGDKFIINQSGNVGIGTDPDFLLHVQNNSATDTKIVIESTGTNSYPAFRVKNDARAYDLGIDGATDGFRIYDVTGTTERLRIDSSGKVGIGSDNPHRTLVLKTGDGDIHCFDGNGGIYMGADNSGGFQKNCAIARAGANNFHIGGSEAGDLCIASESGASMIFGVSPFAGGMDTFLHVSRLRNFNFYGTDYKFHTGSTERFNIQNNGNIGIGTDSPNGQFHIHNSTAGSVTAATDANDLVIESSTNVGMSLLTANDSLARIKFGDPDETGAGVIVYNHQNDKFSIVTATGNRMIIGSDMISARTHYGIKRDTGGYTFRETNEGGERAGMHSNSSNHLIFKTGAADEKVRITHQGNVGIGTDNPADILDINSDQASGVSDVYIRNHATLGGVALNLWTQGTYNSPAHKAIIGCTDSGGTIRMGAASDHPLLLLVNNNEKLRINTDGNVGINSTEPTAKLEVLEQSDNTYGDGVARFKYFETDQNALRLDVLFKTSGSYHKTFTTGSGTDFLIVDADNVAGRHSFTVQGNGGSKKSFTVDSTGLVGIGTENPDERLHVVIPSSTATVAKFERSHNNNVSVEYRNTTSRMYAGLAGDALGFAIDDDANLGVQPMFMVRRSTSYVGVNIANPLRQLDVVGNSILVRPTATTTLHSSGNASAVNNSIIVRMPYGENAATTSNAGARFGIQFTGANNTTDVSSLNWGNDPVKSASIYGVSEDDLGYNRKVGMVFYTSAFDATQVERLRITSAGNMQLGTAADPGNDLRLLDVGNFNTGNNAGSLIRLITRESDGSDSISADIVKYKTGGLVINNNEKIGTAGFISFGTASNGGDTTQRLHISHNGTFTGSSSSNISDQRLKENIATITDPIEKIKALKGRTFTWKTEASMREGTHYGFVAQEVETVIPDLIVEDTGIRLFDKDDNLLPSNVMTPPVGGGYAKSVDADGVTPVLVEALKEALAKIETLEAKVAALEEG